MKEIFTYIKAAVVIPLLLIAMAAHAQLTQPGFVQTDITRQAGITTDTAIYLRPAAARLTTKTFFDGLGRTIQSVTEKASPLQRDMIQPQVYDTLGRQLKAYLPYAGQAADSTGSYRTNALTAQKAFWNQTSQYLLAVDTGAYAQSVVEKSPLQRTIQAGSVGGGFQPLSGQHYKTVNYRPNSFAADSNIYQTGPTGNFGTSYYADGKLWVTDAKDEDGHELLTYTDLAGRTILKRQVTGLTHEPWYETYYVYNNAGMLKYIVPPKAVYLVKTHSGYSINTTAVHNLIYIYTYNVWGQLTTKKVPNAGTSFMIYDPLNRPVLSCDSMMVNAHKWHYIKYDAKGRVIITGIYTDASHTPATMQAYVSGLTGYNTTWWESRTTSTTYHSYTNNVFPTTGEMPLAYAYYDNYDITGDGVYDFAYKAPSGLTNSPTAETDSLKGVPTMTQVTTLGPGISTPIWLTTVTFYDRYGHPIQTRSNNQLNYITQNTVTDTATTVPDFNGRPQQTKVTKVTGSGTGGTNSVITTFNYDKSNNRISSIDQQYNAQAKKRIVAYTYNEAGQLDLKKLDSMGVSTWLQHVNFRYNIRGQITNINNSQLRSDSGKTSSESNDVFGMQVMYDKPDTRIGTVTPSYSGMISAVKWMARDGHNHKTNERSYIYNYDQLGRDTSAWYAERDTGTTVPFNVNEHGFDEYGITYDEAGNILTLKRNSSIINASSHTMVDNLSYTYDTSKPNQLDKVVDATGNISYPGFRNLAGSTSSYVYNSNGSLVTDPYKDLKLKYNLNIAKVDSITFMLSGSNKAYITYTYDGGGNVIRKNLYSDSTTLASSTDYIGGFVYTTTSGTTTLSYIQNVEGRIIDTAGSLTQEYVFADQQGNARFSFKDNGTSMVIRQENSYYPFGEVMSATTVTTPTTPNINLYNGGSEWQAYTSNLPDYHETFYRNYDPAIGRFIGVDPDPESASDLNVYQYAGNNPVMGNDPMGDREGPPLWAPKFNNSLDMYYQQNIDAGKELQQFESDLADYNSDSDGMGGSTSDGDYSASWGNDPLGEAAQISSALQSAGVDRVTMSAGDFHNIEHTVDNLGAGQALTLNINGNGNIVGWGMWYTPTSIGSDQDGVSTGGASSSTNGDPYSYAGNIFHLPGSLLPANNRSYHQYGNSCVFYSITGAMAFFGEKVDGLDLVADYADLIQTPSHPSNELFNEIMGNGVYNPDLTTAYNDFLNGYFTTPGDAMQGLASGYPVLGTYHVSGNSGHDVMITGVSYFPTGPNAGFNYAYWDPNGGYGYKPASAFTTTFVVTGVTGVK